MRCPSLVLPFILASLASALRIPFRTYSSTAHELLSLSRSTRRATASNVTVGLPIKNVNNVEYLGNLTLNGNTFTVILDTGSADLWVAGNVPNATDLGKSVSLSYAIGTANGNVHSATLTFGNYTVQNQAFVLVQDTSAFSSDFSTAAYQGLLGLGPNTGSVIYRKVDASDNSADSTLFRIFEGSQTTSDYITFLLNRANDAQESFAGEFTIAEVVPQFSNITNQPKLTIKDVPTLTDADQHWAVLTDGWGVTGPDGNFIQIGSSVPRVDSKKLVAVLDSGFTFSQVPRDMSDAIYGRVQGAIYDTTNELWRLPCDQELNVTFHFGGVDFPIHPLDTSSSDIQITKAGVTYCTGTFQPITTAFSLLGEYDVILGMSFLRNAYTLIDFGNFVKGGKDSSDPFVQLLPLTSQASAHADFVQSRLSGVDTTGSASKTLVPASQESHSPQSAAEIKAHREQKILKYWPYILVGCLAFVVISLGLCIWACCMRRKRQRAAARTAKSLPLSQQYNLGSFHNLSDSALPAAHKGQMESTDNLPSYSYSYKQYGQ
ncbi:acid protease [Vararia minispora EC-137]|uniref:Acid protease n=1 Tax=Vararia minispora EC-137 TaxID=1314806 RepID=A0ACB8Q7Q4_9AGAM|nr:acid protease [Vararia minispora EC-137]